MLPGAAASAAPPFFRPLLTISAALQPRSCRGRRLRRHSRTAGEELNHQFDNLSCRILRLIERSGLLIANPKPLYLDLKPRSSLEHFQAASIMLAHCHRPMTQYTDLALYSLPSVEERPNNPPLVRMIGSSCGKFSVWPISELLTVYKSTNLSSFCIKNAPTSITHCVI